MVNTPNYSKGFLNIGGVANVATCPIATPGDKMSLCQARLDLTLDLKLLSKKLEKKLASNIQSSDVLQRRYLYETYKGLYSIFNAECRHTQIVHLYWVLEYTEAGIVHAHGMVQFSKTDRLNTCLRKIRALVRRRFHNPKFGCIEPISNIKDSINYLCKTETKVKDLIYSI